MKRFVIIGLILIFVTILSGQSTIHNHEGLMSMDNDPDLLNKMSQQRCTSARDDLIFCISSPSVSVKLGQSVPIVISVRNMTDKNISIAKDKFDSIYSSTVIDSKGKRVLSLKEELQEKRQATNKVTEEMIRALPVNPPFGSITIPAREKIEITFNLAYFYYFKTKGKYKAVITSVQRILSIVAVTH